LSSLDAALQSQILNLLQDIQERQHLSYLFISHDLGAVYHLADRVAVLYLGRLAEIAPTDVLFRRPAHPYTRALLSAIPHIGSRPSRDVSLRGEASALQTSRGCCLFHVRCPLASDICRECQPRLESTATPNHVAACHFKD
jgi:oligopeptide/dipeptide ABC transporter ATP-binding protein